MTDFSKRENDNLNHCLIVKELEKDNTTRGFIVTGNFETTLKQEM